MYSLARRAPQTCRILASIQSRFLNAQSISTTACHPQIVQSEAERSAKPLTNEPIIKQMFLGLLDQEMFVFPEIATNEELEDIEMMADVVEKFISEVDSEKIDRACHIPQEVIDKMKQLGLFGMQIPAEYGGLEFNNTKYARVCEHIALDGSLAVTLAAHQTIGLKGILLVGTDAQKQKYLPRLATGELIAAFCLSEAGSGSDAQSLQTKATLSEDGSHYLLNGGKVWISNGGIADIMTVFAKTESVAPDGNISEKVSAFIVERSFGGVISGKPEDKMGIRGSNTCTVTFENTPVPVDNVLGEIGQGFQLAMSILNCGRFSMGSSGAGVIRHLLKGTIDYALTRKQFGRPIGDFQLIKEKLSAMAADGYAMESMSYLTAGLMDRYEQPDLSLESAAVKIFSSEAVWSAVSESLQIFGGNGYIRDYPYERYIRDARILLIFEGTNEILRMFIAGNALQHAGKSLTNDLKRFKDPFNNFGFIVNKMFENRRSKSTGLQDLRYEVHPNFSLIAAELSKYAYEFSIAVREQLANHGRKIALEQIRLARCADIVIDLYAVSACISRASRSVAIGLRNSDHERDLTFAFTKKAFHRIEKNIKGLQGEAAAEPDEEYMRISDRLYEAGGYCAERPLTK